MEEEIRQRVGEIIGEASMCWSEEPKGVFNSDRALELLNEVMERFESALKQQKADLIKEVEKMKKNVKIMRVGGIFNGDIPIHCPDEEKEDLVKQTLNAVIQLLSRSK